MPGLSRRGTALALGVVVFVLFAVTATYDDHQNNDTYAALLPAWKLGQHGTLRIPEFLGLNPWIHDYGSGRVLSDRMPGIIFFAAPFYAIFGVADGATWYPATLASVTATTGAMVALFLVFDRLATRRTAVVATAIAAFGTGTWTISADALWGHGPSQLWISLALLAACTGRLATSGLALGFAITVRPHLALSAATVGIGESLKRGSVRPVVSVGLASSLGVVMLLAYNRLVFGSWQLLAGTYGSRPNTASETVQGSGLWLNILGTLVSPARGILVMSPFLLLLLPGLRAAWKAADAWIRGAAVGGLAYMLAQLAGNYFAGGASFYSYRLPLEFLTLCAPMLLLCWREWTSRSAWRRSGFAALAVISITQHALGAIRWRDDFPSKEPLAWSRYLVAYAVEHAPAWQLGITAGVGVIASLAAWWLLTHPTPQNVGPSTDASESDTRTVQRIL